MSVLSLNVRGVGGVEKGRALSQLFKTTTPYIIILQETMVAETQAIETFFQTGNLIELKNPPPDDNLVQNFVASLTKSVAKNQNRVSLVRDSFDDGVVRGIPPLQEEIVNHSTLSKKIQCQVSSQTQSIPSVIPSDLNFECGDTFLPLQDKGLPNKSISEQI